MGMEGAELFPDKGGEGRLHIEKIEPSWTGFIQHYQPYITLTSIYPLGTTITYPAEEPCRYDSSIRRTHCKE